MPTDKKPTFLSDRQRSPGGHPYPQVCLKRSFSAMLCNPIFSKMLRDVNSFLRCLLPLCSFCEPSMTGTPAPAGATAMATASERSVDQR
ncbi:MAG: hypothetical protein J5W83_18920, partial [Candidatus Accumulibacter sp.]|uniref:hypothetical protein n=1 Tax=Accumulibacter sp. TaxID=2053492 RepID=UPI001B1D8460